MNPTAGLQRERTEAQFERTLKVTGPVTLDVSTRAGVVRIRRGEDGLVTIRGVLRARPSIFSWIHPGEQLRDLASDPPVRQAGNSIQIGDVADRWLLRRVSLLVDITTPAATSVRALGDSADLRVEGIHGPVDCETDSGEIQIANIHAAVSASSDSGAIQVREIAGSADTRTDSGEIRIANMHSAVSASSDSGAIHIREVEGSVDTRTDSGEIEALQITGGIDAHSDSGNIRLSQNTPRPVYAQSDSGSIRLKLADGGGYTLRVRTDNGRVEMPDITHARSSGHEMGGAVRGGGSVVAIETDSGDIEVV